MAPRALWSPLSAVPTHSPLSQHAMMGPWKQHPEVGSIDKHSLTPRHRKTPTLSKEAHHWAGQQTTSIQLSRKVRERKDGGNGLSGEMIQGNTDCWKVQEAVWGEISALVPYTAHLALISSPVQQSPLPGVFTGPDEIMDIQRLHRDDAQFM